MGIVSKGEHAGETAIQKAKLRNKVAGHWLNKRINLHMQRGGELPDAATREAWYKKDWNKADRQIGVWQASAAGLGPDSTPAVWFDSDPSGAHAMLREARGETIWASKFIAPISAGLMGATNTVDRGPHTATYNEEGVMGGLDWLTRLSAGTYLATALRASGSDSIIDIAKPWKWPGIVEAVGSDEQLNLIQQGHDLISLAPELNVGDVNPMLGPFADLVSATGWVDKDTITNLGDYNAALLISLFDLDAFMLIKPAVKLVQGAVKLTGAGAKVSKAAGRLPGLSNTRLTQEASVAYNHKAVEKVMRVWDEGARDASLTKLQRATNVLKAIEEMPAGQQAMVDVLMRAVTAENVGLSDATLQVIQKSRRVKAAYLKEFGRAHEAQREAAGLARAAEGKARATRSVAGTATKADKKAAQKLMTDKQVLELVRVAQLDHMANAKVLADLLSHGKALARMGQRATHQLPQASVDKINANLQVSAKKLQEAIARQGVAKVGQESLDAEVAVSKAATEFSAASVEAGKALGGKAARALDDMLKDADLLTKASEEALDAVAKKAVRLKIITAKDLKQHRKAIARVRRAGGGEAHYDNYLGASRKALGDLEESYRKLMAGAEGNVAALAETSESMLEAARQVDLGSIGRQALRVQRAAKEVLSPTVARHATTDEAAQGVAQGMENSQRLAFTDMANLQGRTLAETLDNLTRWLSTNETVVGAAGRASQFNSKLQIPMWELAKPYLRALAIASNKSAKRADDLVKGGKKATDAGVAAARQEATDTEKMLEALALAFLLPKKGDTRSYGDLTSILKRILLTGTRGSKGSDMMASNLTFNGLMEEMMMATDKFYTKSSRTPEQVGEAFAKEQGRAAAIMAQVVSQAAIINRGGTQMTSLVTEAGLDLSPAVMRAMEHIGKGQGHRAGAYLNDAMAAFAALGLDPTAAKLAQKSASDVRAGVRVIEDQISGGNIFTSQRLVGILGDQLTSIVKTQEAFNRGEVDASSALVSGVFSALSRWINTSLLTGNIFNNPQYFARNQIGDTALMWAHPDVGAYMAAKIAKQSSYLVAGGVVRTSPPFMALYAVEAIPGLGTTFKRARLAAADRLGVAYSSVLPTLTEVLINPRLNMVMDTRFATASMVYTRKVGADTTYGQVREAILDQRITTSFASVSGLTNLKARSSFEGGYVERAARALGIDVADVTVAHVVKNETDVVNKAIAKALGKKVSELTKADYLQAQASSALFNALMKSKHAEALMKNLGLARADYAHVADMYDTHQRTLLFMELIDQGHSFGSAGKIVREALLDWASPASTLELQTISKLMMFWHYHRRAMGRGFSLLVSPFVGTNADDSIARSFLKGSSVWSALAGEVPYTTAALRDMTKVQKTGQEYMRSGEEYDPSEDPALRGVYMGWLSGQDSLVGLNNFPLTPYEQDANTRYGRKYTHKAKTAPGFEPLAMADFWLGQANLLTAWAVNDAVGTSDVLREEMLGIAAMGGRVTGPMITGLVDEFTGGGQARYVKDQRAGIRVNRFFDREVLGAMNKLPVVGDFMYEDTEGSTRATPGWLAAYRLGMMPLSIELARWAEPLMEAYYTKEEMAEVPGYVMRQWTGLGSERYHTPADTIKWDRKEVSDKASASRREAKKVARPK